MSDLVSLLDNILGQHQKHTNGEFYWNCPFCGHSKKKLAINVNKGAWHCWVCNASGRKLLSLFRKLDCSKEQITELRKLLQEDIPYVHTDVVTASLSLPKEYQPLWKESSKLDYKHAKKYLADRGITEHDIRLYQIGYCSEGIYANRIIVPSYDESGQLNYFVARSFYEGSGMKYKNPPVSKNVVAFDNLINWNENIVLCEGVFDAIAIKRNAIPLLGKTIPTKLLEKIFVKNTQRIYLMLDNDALRATLKLAERLMNEGREVYVILSDGKDPSEMGFDESLKQLNNAHKLTFSEFMKLNVMS